MLSRGGSSRAVRVLLYREANVSVTDDDVTTLGTIPLKNGYHDVTVELIKAGADLEARTSNGTTPLHKAARNGRSEVVAALIAAGADAMRCGRALGRYQLGVTPYLTFLSMLSGGRFSWAAISCSIKGANQSS